MPRQHNCRAKRKISWQSPHYILDESRINFHQIWFKMESLFVKWALCPSQGFNDSASINMLYSTQIWRIAFVKTLFYFFTITLREVVVVTVASSLQWRHNERDSVSNHQPHDCLLNCLFRHRSKKTSKLRVTGLCEGNSPGTGEFPAQRASTE